MPQVRFVDVTNRDAVQASRISLAKLQKTMLNIYLSKLGIAQAEFSFPFSRHEWNYLKANQQLADCGALGGLTLEGWTRALRSDVESFLPSGVRAINLSLSTSDQMITHKFRGRLDQKAIIREMTEAVKFAREAGIRVLGANAEDASRTELGFLIEFGEAAKEAGAERFRYCDTLGYDTPQSIYERMRTLAERLDMPLEVHCHDDVGMAVANSVSGAMGAVDGGSDCYINTTVLGLGERAGNADLLSCILAFKFARGADKYPVGDPINLKWAARLSRYVSYAFGIPIPINQVGVGANAFAHESGIHADGALKDRRNYELYDFELLGLDEQEETPQKGRIITTGEYGGIAGLKYVYSRLGIEFSNDQEAQAVLDLVQVANAHTQLPLTEDELRFIVQYPAQARLVLSLTP